MSEPIGVSKGHVARVIILALLFLVGGFVVMRLMFSMRPKPKRKSFVEQKVSVETQQVRGRSLHLHLEGYGTAEAKSIVELVPEVSGQAVYVSPLLKQDARVGKGTLLVRIDPRDYNLELQRLKKQLQALRVQIKVSEQALQVHQRNLKRNKRLLQTRAIDDGSYEQQEMGLLDRIQRLESLKQSAETTEIQIATASLKVQKTQIRVPFDARVVSGNLVQSGYVTQGKSVATLESREAVLIPVAFPSDALRNIRDQQGKIVDLEQLPNYLSKLPAVQVTISGTTSPIWSGRVVRVGAKLDLNTRTLPLWIQVDLNPKGAKNSPSRSRHQTSSPSAPQTLLPGTFCHLRVPVTFLQDAIALPKPALYEDSVYLVVNERIQRRKVVVGHTSATHIYVTSGLSLGELVIISPLVDPLEGTPVIRAGQPKRRGEQSSVWPSTQETKLSQLRQPGR